MAGAIDLGVSATTLWVLSTDNFRRKPDEISGILTAIEIKLKLLADNFQVHRQRIRVRAVGRLELLAGFNPRRGASRRSRNKGRWHVSELTIAAAYSGRQEIADAVKAFLREQVEQEKVLKDVVELLTPDAIGKFLYAPDLPDPDLIIRISGEIRLSGFLLWQSAYSEFYFTDVFWPAFRRIDFLRAVRAWQQPSAPGAR
jgi:short-chain Z-isoprenyl diphosphate synthase